ncbi:MAG TPA: hypothetical protein V6D28_21900 [Leptolyngbyaceae cyanobacterium]
MKDEVKRNECLTFGLELSASLPPIPCLPPSILGVSLEEVT